MGKMYSVNIRYAVFNCPEFDSRIYEYENDVQGAFSIPFYYGNGSRFYINIGLKFHRTVSLYLRYSKTWLDDTEKYNPRSDVKLQLKMSI
jgi:hypothetical protein